MCWITFNFARPEDPLPLVSKCSTQSFIIQKAELDIEYTEV